MLGFGIAIGFSALKKLKALVKEVKPMKAQNRWVHLFVILLVTVLLVSACGNTTNGGAESGSGSSSSSQSTNDPEQYPDVKNFVDGFCLGEVNPGASGAVDPYKNMSYMYRERRSSGEL